MPLFATRRTEGRATRGHEIEEVAQLLGLSLYRWQRRICDVALEVDDHGIPVYRVIIVLVARQQGKTLLVFLLLLHRLLFWGGGRQTITYSAQTIADAMDVWESKLFPLALESCLSDPYDFQALHSHASAGLRSSAGMIRVTTAARSSGHGSTLDLAVLDEAHAYRDASREMAVLPAMRTRPDAQLIILSYAGDDESEYLVSRRDLGRRVVGEDRRDGIAYFEYGLSADADPDDESLWPDALPGMSEGSCTVETIRAERELMDRNDWRRASLNQWITGPAGEPMVDVDVWERVVSAGAAPSGPLWLGMAAARDRSTAALVVCGDGVLEVVRAGGRIDWVDDAVRGMWRVHGDSLGGVVTPAGGPLVAVAESLRLDNVPVAVVKAGDVSQAAGMWWEAVHTGSVTLRPHASWWRSLTDLEARPSGAGMTFRGVRFAAELGPVVAGSLALWASVTKPGDAGGWDMYDWDGDTEYDEWRITSDL